MTDLKYDPGSLVGPVDERVVEELKERWPLDPAYLSHVRAHHGGVPGVAVFDAPSGTYQVARFLSLLDEESKLPGPHRPHFEIADRDERIVRSVSELVHGEHATARALFEGLMPFAALGEGADGMCLDRGYVDLLCFDYRRSADPAPVVRWSSHDALDAFLTWEGVVEELDDDAQDEEYDSYSRVPWEKFLEPVAPSFAALLAMLRPE